MQTSFVKTIRNSFANLRISLHGYSMTRIKTEEMWQVPMGNFRVLKILCLREKNQDVSRIIIEINPNPSRAWAFTHSMSVWSSAIVFWGSLGSASLIFWTRGVSDFPKICCVVASKYYLERWSSQHIFHKQQQKKLHQHIFFIFLIMFYSVITSYGINCYLCRRNDCREYLSDDCDIHCSWIAYTSLLTTSPWSNENMLGRSRWVCFQKTSRSLNQPISQKQRTSFQQWICSVLQKVLEET